MEILMFVVFLGICVFQGIEYNKIKHDLKLYMNKYKETEKLSEKYLVSINTINRIYKETEFSIVDNLIYITSELKIRLVKISKHRTITNKDKKFLFDLILVLGYRLSLERVLEIQNHRFSDIKINNACNLKEASEGLLELINHSRLFSDHVFEHIPSQSELDSVYEDLQKTIEYVNKLILY